MIGYQTTGTMTEGTSRCCCWLLAAGFCQRGPASQSSNKLDSLKAAAQHVRSMTGHAGLLLCEGLTQDNVSAHT